jgi:hypothetical protein
MRPELKRFALKFFFSNQYLYAHVQRRADGVVRAGRLVPPSHAVCRLTAAPQIVAAASTIEKELRESLPSRTDVSAAARIGAPPQPLHQASSLSRVAGELLAQRSKAVGVD